VTRPAAGEPERRPTGPPDGDGRHRDYADYHDPLAGIGGAPPAYSALTLRLVLAAFGLVVCGIGALVLAIAGAPVAFVVFLAVLALIAAVDIVVIVRRKRRGEPGWG
jgi:hypothetical protein